MEYSAIITNMTFWQSSLWLERTDSIYTLDPNGSEPSLVSPWREAWRLFRKRGHYDVVLTMGIRESMAYALLCAIVGRPSKQIMTEVFIDEEQPNKRFWRLKTRLYGRLARRALGIITNSSEEVRTTADRFCLPEDRLIHVPLCTTIPPQEATETHPLFVLTAGRTLRDYDLLIHAARQLDAPIVIICGQNDLSNLTVPQNVSVLREVNRDTYLDYLRACAIVALPLLRTNRSTGQVVMLEAMAMGKPVVTTQSPGTTDYIRHENNGFLVEHDDATAWVRHIRALLQDATLRRRVGNTAREDIGRAYLPDHHAAAKLEAIRSLLVQNGNTLSVCSSCGPDTTTRARTS